MDSINNQEQLKLLLIQYFTNQNRDDIVKLLQLTELKTTDSDLEVLLQLSKIAGGDQLIQNRIRKPLQQEQQQNQQNMINLFPVIYKRGRFTVPKYKINICNDSKCLSMQIISLVDPSLSFSVLQNNRFDPHYNKQSIPNAKRIESLSKNSLYYAWQRMEHPHSDYTVQESGWTRRQIHTTPLSDITPKDFEIFTAPFESLNKKWSKTQLKVFLLIKRICLNALSMNEQDTKSAFQPFNTFITSAQSGFTLDLGQVILSAAYLTPQNLEVLMKQVQTVPLTLSQPPELVIIPEVNQNLSQPEESSQLVDSPNNQETVNELMNSIDQELQKAVEDSLKNIDDYFPNATEEEKEFLKQVYMQKMNQSELDQLRNSQPEYEHSSLSSVDEPQFFEEKNETEIVQLSGEMFVQNVLAQIESAPSGYFIQVKFSEQKTLVTVPLLPVLSYVDFPSLPSDFKVQSNDTLRTIKGKLQRLQNKLFLEQLYDETNDSCLTQIVPSTCDSEPLLSLLKEQTLITNNLKVYTDGIRTGGVQVVQVEENEDVDEDENIFVIGEEVLGKYQVLRNCGNATFSSCYAVKEIINGKEVCLKVIKNEKEFLDQGLDEIRLLQFVKDMGGEQFNMITIMDAFYYREHLMIVFPLLGEDLYTHQHNRAQQKLPNDYSLQVIKEISKQQLNALNFLHSLAIVHLDIKPENILTQKGFVGGLTAPKSTLIDLGSSSFIFDKIHQYIQSRSYRAPEIMMGCCYDQRADIWSIGGVLAEMLTQKVLFPNHSVGTMMSRMTSFFGPFSTELILSGRAAQKYITAGLCAYEQDYLIIPENNVFEFWLFDEINNLSDEELLFSDYLRQMMRIDWLQRPTAAMLLQHPFNE
ncbi:Kinase [Hexamita inflata]|uniref:CMGC DYRK n=1 Tax=Hexamita inflata TaxID=28002 RepID=A0AA86U6V5_9EUKA|nr:CMGC DYRK [Hexamita inflata]